MKSNIFLSMVITVVCARNVRNDEFHELPEEKLLDALCRSFHKQKNSTLSCDIDVCKWNTTFNLKDLQSVSTKSMLAPPQLTCKEDDMAYFLLDNQDDYAYFLSVESNQIEIFSTVSTCSYLAVRNLMEVAFRVRLWGVSFSRKQVVHSDVLDITPPAMNTAPSPVADIFVKNITCGSSSCYATIKWSPNEDYSCQYELIWINDRSIMEDEINVISGIHEASMNDLEFETTYTVNITARTGDMYEGGKKSVSFRTPTCLEVHKNLERCAPEPPRNLLMDETKIDGSQKYDLHIKWEKPHFQPMFYKAHFTNLFNLFDHNATRKFLNISGNSTHAVFEKVSLGDIYHVSLEACSQAGCSDKVATEHHKIDPVTMEVTSHDQWWVFAFILTLLISLLMGAVVVTYYRIKKIRKDDRERKITTFLTFNVELDEDNAPGGGVLKGRFANLLAQCFGKILQRAPRT